MGFWFPAHSFIVSIPSKSGQCFLQKGKSIGIFCSSNSLSQSPLNRVNVSYIGYMLLNLIRCIGYTLCLNPLSIGSMFLTVIVAMVATTSVPSVFVSIPSKSGQCFLPKDNEMYNKIVFYTSQSPLNRVNVSYRAVELTEGNDVAIISVSIPSKSGQCFLLIFS